MSTIATITNMTSAQRKYFTQLTEQASHVSKDNLAYENVQKLVNRFVSDIAENPTMDGTALILTYESARKLIEDEILNPRRGVNRVRVAQEQCIEDAFRRFGLSNTAKTFLDWFIQDTKQQVNAAESILDGNKPADGASMSDLVEQVAAKYLELRSRMAKMSNAA